MHSSLLLALIPITATVAFFIHWFLIAHIPTAQERLPWCRPTYLGLSSQLLIYSWIVPLAFGGKSSLLLLVPLGMTASWLGDIFNLHFDSISTRMAHPLVGGIYSFMAAQIFYLLFMLSQVDFNRLLSEGYLFILLPLLVVVPALLFRFRVWNPARPKSIMISAFVYGLLLGATAAVAIAAAFSLGGPWIESAIGFLFFLLSDAVMGETTVYGRHPRFEFQIPWGTYLIAQGFILYGFLRVIIGV